MVNVALFGPPGAGKGTQSAFLIKKYNFFYISTGDLLREEIKKETKLGLEAKQIIAQGGLVSDEIIVQIIENTIKENPGASGFLFDGFPRTYVQAYILEGLMIKMHTALNCLISIELPEEDSIQRLLNRGKISGRSDDNEQVIKNRLHEYREKTLPVLNFYKEKGNYKALNGAQTVEQVNFEIEKIINKEFSKELVNIVLFGYPGSGRGSQGIALAKKYGLEYLATGKMLEEEINNKSKIGLKIQKLYESGELVPDEIVIQLIEKKIENSKDIKGFIFKGFPRTLVQSYILDGILQKHGTTISKIIEIEVDTLTLIRRLNKRSLTPGCMPYDSSTEKIVKRLEEHKMKTIPVIQKYKETHDVAVINGEDDFDTVFERLAIEVKEKLKDFS